MNRAYRSLITLVLLCAGPIALVAQKGAPPESAVYGAYPANYQEILTAWINASLVSPQNLKVKWLSEPKPGELSVGKGQKVRGYLVDFSVNARNVFGAYTGAQKHTALIRDGQIVTATGFVYR